MEKWPSPEPKKPESIVHVYETSLGEDIHETAKGMVDMAKKEGGSVNAKFSGVELVANSDSTSEDIVASFKAAMDKGEGYFGAQEESK